SSNAQSPRLIFNSQQPRSNQGRPTRHLDILSQFPRAPACTFRTIQWDVIVETTPPDSPFSYTARIARGILACDPLGFSSLLYLSFPPQFFRRTTKLRISIHKKTKSPTAFCQAWSPNTFRFPKRPQVKRTLRQQPSVRLRPHPF